MQIHATRGSVKLIGLTGYATAGKDALADVLVEKLGYVKYGWGDKMYEMALKIDPIIGQWPFRKRLSRIVKKIGWTEAKKIPQVRKYLQWLGTELIRDTLGQDIWVDAMSPLIRQSMREGKSVVLTSCRFPNEADAIEAMGGVMVLVERPGVQPVNAHISDAGMLFDRCIFRVTNDGTIEDLSVWAEAVDAAIGGVHPNPDANMLPFARAVQKGIASGVELILNTAAPASEVAEEWRKRHRVECGVFDEEVEIVVDGRTAGKVKYANNVLEIDAFIAR